MLKRKELRAARRSPGKPSKTSSPKKASDPRTSFKSCQNEDEPSKSSTPVSHAQGGTPFKKELTACIASDGSILEGGIASFLQVMAMAGTRADRSAIMDCLERTKRSACQRFVSFAEQGGIAVLCSWLEATTVISVCSLDDGDAENEAAKYLDILIDCPMTMECLRRTRIGRVVRRVSSCRPALEARADQLLQIWRAAYFREQEAAKFPAESKEPQQLKSEGPLPKQRRLVGKQSSPTKLREQWHFDSVASKSDKSNTSAPSARGRNTTPQMAELVISDSSDSEELSQDKSFQSQAHTSNKKREHARQGDTSGTTSGQNAAGQNAAPDPAFRYSGYGSGPKASNFSKSFFSQGRQQPAGSQKSQRASPSQPPPKAEPKSPPKARPRLDPSIFRGKSLYAVLGLTPQSDKHSIRKAYMTLARRHHPDKGGNAERFKELNKAYEILSNPEARMEYDRAGGLGAHSSTPKKGQDNGNGAGRYARAPQTAPPPQRPPSTTFEGPHQWTKAQRPVSPTPKPHYDFNDSDYEKEERDAEADLDCQWFARGKPAYQDSHKKDVSGDRMQPPSPTPPWAAQQDDQDDNWPPPWESPQHSKATAAPRKRRKATCESPRWSGEEDSGPAVSQAPIAVDPTGKAYVPSKDFDFSDSSSGDDEVEAKISRKSNEVDDEATDVESVDPNSQEADDFVIRGVSDDDDDDQPFFDDDDDDDDDDADADADDDDDDIITIS